MFKTVEFHSNRCKNAQFIHAETPPSKTYFVIVYTRINYGYSTNARNVTKAVQWISYGLTYFETDFKIIKSYHAYDMSIDSCGGSSV